MTLRETDSDPASFAGGPSDDPGGDDTALLARFLAGRSHPCPVCGYDLRDLKTGRCPECGRTVRLTLAEDHPTRAPFVIGLIAFGGPLGASWCTIAGQLYWKFRGVASWPDVIPPLVMNGVSAVLAAIALVLWLRAAPRLRRQPPIIQWAWAAAACAITIAGNVLFLLLSW